MIDGHSYFYVRDVVAALRAREGHLRELARKHGAERPEDLTSDELVRLCMWLSAREWWEQASPARRDRMERSCAIRDALPDVPRTPWWITNDDGPYITRELAPFRCRRCGRTKREHAAVRGRDCTYEPALFVLPPVGLLPPEAFPR